MTEEGIESEPNDEIDFTEFVDDGENDLHADGSARDVLNNEQRRVRKYFAVVGPDFSDLRKTELKIATIQSVKPK